MNLTPDVLARKILVVDDNPVIVKTLSLALESQGYEVFTAEDGPEAFSIVRRKEPDLILLDIFFPPDIAQGGNTWDAFLIIDWFRRIGVADEIPIIIISGAEPEKYKARCLDAGVEAFFSKPVDVPLLLTTIRGILSRNAPEAVPEPADYFPLEVLAVHPSGNAPGWLRTIS
jgi:CheY-like chemotaxis protein